MKNSIIINVIGFYICWWLTIYGAISQIRFIGPGLDILYEDIKNLKQSITIDSKSIMKLNKNIVLKNIHYDYPNASRTALKNINLCVPANTTVGLVGVVPPLKLRNRLTLLHAKWWVCPDLNWGPSVPNARV